MIIQRLAAASRRGLVGLVSAFAVLAPIGQVCAENSDAVDRTTRTTPATAVSAAQDRRLLRDLRDDLIFLARQPDFYLVTGALALAPLALHPAMANEPPALSTSWTGSRTADYIFEPGEVLGSGWLPPAASFLIYALGRSADAPKLTDFAAELLRVHAVNSVLTVGLKYAVNRGRPDGSPYGFPSGHASCAFATAGAIRARFGPWWGLLSAAGATYVAISRLQENVHYLSDVTAGAVLGTYVAYRITHRPAQVGRAQVLPWIDAETRGIVVAVQF